MNRRAYWACTDFADWVRGTPKPQSATGQEWRQWKKMAKSKHPLRFWLAEKGLSLLQDFFNWPLDQWRNLKNYIANRWVFRTHSLTAHPKDIKPGEWSDFGNRILPCLFNELVDFVEIELAWVFCVWNESEMEKFQFTKQYHFLSKLRCPEAGVAHLDWASTLTNEKGELTQQALAAIEIKSLYLWWKEKRPNRPSPDDLSGYSDLYKSNFKEDEDVFDMLGRERSDEERDSLNQTLDKLEAIEALYKKEDEEMMIRLIKIRDNLWA